MNSPRRLTWPETAWIEGHTFLPGPLSAASVVVDCGFNVGGFATAVHDLCGCAVLAAEAEPTLTRAAPDADWLTLENVAITDANGSIDLFVSPDTCATTAQPLMRGSGDTVTVPSKTLETFLRDHDCGAVDLLKLDIEGSETGVFLTTPAEILQNIGQITVEFHDFMDASLKEPVQQSIARLVELGFRPVRLTLDNTDMLFVNRRHLALSAAAVAAILARRKYARGLRNRLRRLLG